MRQFTVSMFAIIGVINAETYIDPKNRCFSSGHCVDLECAKPEWGTVNDPLNNLAMMRQCSQGSEDPVLTQLLNNFEYTINDMQSFYNNTEGQTVCKQDTYRTWYMHSNIVWYRNKMIQKYVYSNKQMKECFNKPLINVYQRLDGGNNCWKRKGHKKCAVPNEVEGNDKDESSEEINETNETNDNETNDNNADKPNENTDNQDGDDGADVNQVCGEAQVLPNNNVTCLVQLWNETTFNRTVPIMENCLTQIPGNTDVLQGFINQYAVALNSMKECYFYSDNKNYVELHERGVRVMEVEAQIKDDVSRLPQTIQDCFAPAFEIAETRYEKRKLCELTE